MQCGMAGWLNGWLGGYFFSLVVMGWHESVGASRSFVF